MFRTGGVLLVIVFSMTVGGAIVDFFDDSGYVEEVADDAVVYDGEDWLLASDIHSDGHTTSDVTFL